MINAGVLLGGSDILHTIGNFGRIPVADTNINYLVVVDWMNPGIWIHHENIDDFSRMDLKCQSSQEIQIGHAWLGRWRIYSLKKGEVVAPTSVPAV
jgi:hypothetical protein